MSTARDGEELRAGGRPSALAPYGRALRANSRLALTVLAAVVCGTAVWLAVRSQTQQASAQLLIAPLPQDDTTFLGLPLLRDSGDPTRTVQTAAALIDTDAAAARTAARLGRGWNRDSVARAVAVVPQGQSNVVDVQAQASSASKAIALANTYAQTALDVRRTQLRADVAAAIASTTAQLQPDPKAPGNADLVTRLNQLRRLQDGRDPTISLSQTATDAQATGTSGALVLALALVAGAILATGVALAAEGLSPRRIAEEDELLETYPLPVLARVGAGGRRSGAFDDAPAEALEAFRSLRVQLELDDRHEGAILFTSASRREGKTRSTIDLARELTVVGRRVVLIDLDLREPHLAPALGVIPGRDLVDVARRDDPLADALHEVPQAPLLRLAAPAARPDARKAEEFEGRLPALIEQARAVADYVLVDAPPLGEISDALNAVRLVDHVLVVARLGVTSQAGLVTLRDLLTRVGRPASGYIVIAGAPRRRLHVPYGPMSGAADADETLVLGSLRMHPRSGRTWRGEDELLLRPAGRKVLERLMRHPGEVVSRPTLYAELAGENGLRRPEDVDRAIRELRMRVDRPFGLHSIETVRGEGYRLRADGGAASGGNGR